MRGTRGVRFDMDQTKLQRQEYQQDPRHLFHLSRGSMYMSPVRKGSAPVRLVIRPQTPFGHVD